MAELTEIRKQKNIEQMLTDARLPASIRPKRERSDTPLRVTLLTGACGFLGRHITRELLSQDEMQIICLIRPRGSQSATARMAEALTAIDVDPKQAFKRLEVIEGDVCEPNFGLDDETYKSLAGCVDQIIHCAALLDWVRSYGQLKKTNVGGVMQAIRFATFDRAIRIIFVSSIAVSFTESASGKINEQTDMLPYIGGMPLGYAQSKCVAEALLRDLSGRGVPVTIVRPGLISGDSVSGHSSLDDFIAALIQSSVNCGIAIDTDWLLDCVPADHVARVVTRIPQGSQNYQALNLVHESPRHWRELILWMNLHGYDVELVDNKIWVREQFEKRLARGSLIYPQRRFFQSTTASISQAPYKTYLADGQYNIDSSASHRRLRELGIRTPPLDSDLLHTYFHYYRTEGLLGAIPDGDIRIRQAEPSLDGTWKSQFFECDQPQLTLLDYERIGSENSLLSEMASSRREHLGLWKIHFTGDGRELSQKNIRGVLKTKPDERVVHDLTIKLSDMCLPKLGRLFRTHYRHLDFAGVLERELAVYEMDEPRYKKYMPVCFATQCDEATGRYALLLEYLQEAEGFGQPYEVFASETGLSSVINGLGELHSVWYGREKELSDLAWLNPRLDVTQMTRMSELWMALAGFSGKWFHEWCGSEITLLQTQLIQTLPQWWGRMNDMPATLIHNDFNPRNLVLKSTSESPSLCVFDWELASVGLPQHDLAEILCFIWQSGMTEETLDEIVENHRQALVRFSGYAIDDKAWREGFVLSLQHLLINRFATYTLIHHFRQLPYLPKVMKNWMRLYRWSSHWLNSKKNI